MSFFVGRKMRRNQKMKQLPQSFRLSVKSYNNMRKMPVLHATAKNLAHVH